MTNARTQAHSRRQDGRGEVTDVTRSAKWLAIVVLATSAAAFAQASTPNPGPEESLYLKLRTVGLDASRVYRIRGASLNRGAVHISLDDGTIAFTQEANGHITGALFQGDGDLLLFPPNTVERASMLLFTGAAILEERFSVAYLRFNDNVYTELKDNLRPPDDPSRFIEQFDKLATTLAQEDGLRLLLTFGNSPDYAASAAGDHLLHAYFQGQKLGAFEVRYDSLLPESVSVGQHKNEAGRDYYDVWTSFSDKRAPPPETDPDTGLSSQRDFEITQFTINAEIKPPNDLSATAALSIVPRRSGSRMLLFELSRLLQVQSVEANGQAVAFIHNQAVEGSQLARRGNDALAVFLPRPMKVGDSIQLKISYAGSVLSQAANGLLYVGERGTWYPNTGFAMSTFDMQFRYPPGWTLVAAGRRTELKNEGDQQVSHWVTERKIPVAGFNLGKYSRFTSRAAGVNVETYATSNVEKGFVVADSASIPLPDPLKRPEGRVTPLLIAPPPPELPTPSRNLELVSKSAGEALDYYAQRFGPYPYGGLMLTQFPGNISQGWPGLVFLSSYAFLNDREREQVEHDPVERLEIEQVVAHETAHQWWGDLVTWNGYRDQWIMEALANYSAMMLLESKDPKAFQQLMQRYRDNLLTKGPDDSLLMDAGPVTLGQRLSSSKFPQAYQAISYGRGTWVFHMIRTMLRDAEQGSPTRPAKGSEEPFVRALRTLRKDYEGKAITTAQLLSVFEAQLPKSLWYEDKKSLDWFFDSWLNGTAVPRFDLRDVKIGGTKTMPIVTGTILQEHAPDTLVTAVPLYAVVGNKNILLRRIFADGRETPFRLVVPAGTRKILLDPEQTLLSRAK
jgi:hypothetical protein